MPAPCMHAAACSPHPCACYCSARLVPSACSALRRRSTLEEVQAMAQAGLDFIRSNVSISSIVTGAWAERRWSSWEPAGWRSVAVWLQTWPARCLKCSADHPDHPCARLPATLNRPRRSPAARRTANSQGVSGVCALRSRPCNVPWTFHTFPPVLYLCAPPICSLLWQRSPAGGVGSGAHRVSAAAAGHPPAAPDAGGAGRQLGGARSSGVSGAGQPGLVHLALLSGECLWPD